MQTLLHSLNDAQRQAVTLPAESALILAGAGSGKTRVLTTRIAWLIANGLASPSGILAVTFTNKAAKEMLARLDAMLPMPTRGMWVGTFHGLCNRLLRAHYRDAGLPQSFQILDSQDQLSFIKRLLKAHAVDDTKYPPRTLMHFINSAKDQGLRADAVDVPDRFSARLAELYALYDAQCQREGVVDFAELLLRADELLERNVLLREHYQARFRHILVDEFQDTNDLQYRWLKRLAGAHNAVFAVGDDDQSIYAFRGANVDNMRSFERELRAAHLIKLEHNYRSHGHILDCANALISHNRQRMGKALFTDAGHGEPVRIYEAASDLAEAQWIVEEVRQRVQEGSARSAIALLYRANAQSRVLEHALVAAGVPYRVYGGLRFFERAEIKHALAYLQLMENPHNDSAFLRVVNFPVRGIGARTLETLQEQARMHGASLYASVAHMSGKGGNALAAFVRMIESLRFETQHTGLAELIQRVIEHSGMTLHYQSEKEGRERLENLEQLVSAASLFLHEERLPADAPALLGPSDRALARLAQEDQVLDADTQPTLVMSPLAAFLAHASLEAGDNQAAAGDDALQLMTVHAAKGLEFDTVFVTGLEEGLFPHENSSASDAGLEEERRLMYVAITRARRNLFLSFAQSRMLHGQTRYGLRSRFLEELPQESLKWINLAPRGRVMPHHPEVWSEAPTLLRGSYAAAQVRNGWRIGQNVRHAKFGEGVILQLEGQPPAVRAHIRFAQAGSKTLDLSIAKLEAI